MLSLTQIEALAIIAAVLVILSVLLIVRPTRIKINAQLMKFVTFSLEADSGDDAPGKLPPGGGDS